MSKSTLLSPLSRTSGFGTGLAHNYAISDELGRLTLPSSSLFTLFRPSERLATRMLPPMLRTRAISGLVGDDGMLGVAAPLAVDPLGSGLRDELLLWLE